MTFSRVKTPLIVVLNINNSLNFHRTVRYLSGIHIIFSLCKGHKSFLPPPKGVDVYHRYLDPLTGTNDVILSLKNKLNKHLETFNNAN